MEKIINLENEIVELRPIQLEDAEGILRAGMYPEIWEHLSVSLLTKEAVELYIENAIKEREANISYSFVIIDKATNQIIGSTSFLDIAENHKRVEIGSTWIQPGYWRTSINTNCKFLLLKYCFEELKLNRVQIKTGHENVRSQKAIERLGATKEGVLRNHMIRKEGTIRHTVMYSIIFEEWPEIKARFLGELLNK
ncbi:GNAT family N-acetyltransferase [Ureibacillus chungkukjangi]|uniref:RimJ/RimL family protein N-acetyltransferase n=1 Tax=Ureibacillus chungkukjangi TaxID=1202712 RepID=A0A318TPL1_9BACL|nr:GNAT family N-acetyltransferase [Ureibacillus chungkukjangi]PYF06792.1 RimJ/RimL family protein N-acetyltransferase [Ureibacillus chungkukjangi]